ncbi:Asp-tRNA(Asn)/Glu-tRNA(Gln) amidotransferase subunit GatC [uncultured Ilyobacter sp.]|uniref:Asp-tRNA(Asn)/Glu-tRNA(Gln) amidotransferase subunit GatC n=1 Tax=uncultured Ilyobacter sp. TaxID=544433 RepID=UPI0029F48E4D|nr:Asp-tRNA(Asn)/Glu-tRNA(Gln) amidotransferase subunit GatC [uncultured Ilyobacter sp.]
MPAAMDESEVRRIADLARLKLRDDEVAALRHELARIIDYFDQLGSVDTEGVAPCASAVAMIDMLRAEEPRPGLTVRQALANSPDVRDNCFRVPPVLDAGSGV